MTIQRLLAVVLALTLAACASLGPPQGAAALDPLAERFVKLTLQIGVKEEGYVDAYHGPPPWVAEAKAAPLPIAALKTEAAALERALAGSFALSTPLERKRRAFLLAHVRAAAFRLRMIEGYRAPFQVEAEALFAVRPPLPPLASFDAEIARIDALVPGAGPLPERVIAFRKRHEIPAANRRAVTEAVIAECRRRTRAHIDLPPGERFDLEFVTGKPWGAYNWFKGDARSLIQVNTDLPASPAGVMQTGCHEGYPGHHVQNILMERLHKERGWAEFSIWPLFAPIGLIAEGSANAGVDLAFPGGEKLAYLQQVLYPLAGLDPATAPAYEAFTKSLQSLGGAQYTIADAYLAGRIDRATAIAQLQRYQMSTPERAAKSADFIDTYRSYIINYELGYDMVAARLERAGPSPDARWEVMETLLSEPTLPADLGAALMFASDNAAPAHPKILAALAACNDGVAPSYGADEWTRRAEGLLREIFETDCAALLVPTGTAANALSLAALTPPWGAVFTHRLAHIAQDEAGAPEFYTGGAKLLLLDGPSAKLEAATLDAEAARYRRSWVHGAQPFAVSISQVTECGAVYRAPEVAALAARAHAHGLKLHMDGARFANALVATGATPAELSWKAGVDVLSFGATKNGALAVEAIVCFDKDAGAALPHLRKRAGHLFSKHRYLAAQMVAYLEDGLWLDLARRANASGAALAGVFRAANVALAHPADASMLFAHLAPTQREALTAAGVTFHPSDGAYRFVASWATADEAIEAVRRALT